MSLKKIDKKFNIVLLVKMFFGRYLLWNWVTCNSGLGTKMFP